MALLKQDLFKLWQQL